MSTTIQLKRGPSANVAGATFADGEPFWTTDTHNLFVHYSGVNYQIDTAVNSFTGAVTIAAGSGITVTNSGGTITIAASGGSSMPAGVAKGDLAVYNGTSWVVLAPGSDNSVLQAESTATDGVQWGYPTLSTGTVTGTSTTLTSASYVSLSAAVTLGAGTYLFIAQVSASVGSAPGGGEAEVLAKIRNTTDGTDLSGAIPVASAYTVAGNVTNQHGTAVLMGTLTITSGTKTVDLYAATNGVSGMSATAASSALTYVRVA